MAHYTYNSSRSRFQALFLINTQLFKADRNFLRQTERICRAKGRENKGVEKMERKTAKNVKAERACKKKNA